MACERASCVSRRRQQSQWYTLRFATYQVARAVLVIERTDHGFKQFDAMVGEIGFRSRMAINHFGTISGLLVLPVAPRSGDMPHPAIDAYRDPAHLRASTQWGG